MKTPQNQDFSQALASGIAASNEATVREEFAHARQACDPVVHDGADVNVLPGRVQGD
jgi:hypothetical protein